MLKHNIKYEWIGLVRDRWILILVILFVSLTLFAVRNGKEKVNDRITNIAKERDKVAKVDAQYTADIAEGKRHNSFH